MITEPSAPYASRPNVLSLPSATTARLVLLLTAILSGGAYVGISIHDWLLANSYVQVAAACVNGAALRGLAGDAGYLESCLWSADIRRGLFALSAALILTLTLVAILLLAQTFIGRRRPGKEMVQYFEESRDYLEGLRSASGVNSHTTILVGPAGQRDAFTYGAFGRYRVQLPRGLAAKWQTRSLFEPVLLHEFAHISHRDVKWGWFARASWYAVTPVLLASIVVPAVQHDWDYFWSYTWRVILLIVLTQLLIRGYLRARETDADLRAAQILHDTTDITAAISRNVPVSGRRPNPLAFHPSPKERVSSIMNPVSTVRVSFTDGFAAALLATLASGICLGITQNLLEGLSNSHTVAEILSIGISNAILGFAVGGALLRSFTMSRVTGQSASAVAPAFGVGLGVAVGLLASLSQTGLGTFDGSGRPWQVIVIACAGIAATAYSAAIARLWSFTVPLATRPRASWIAYCALATAIFWVVGWVSSRLGDILDFFSGSGVWGTLHLSYLTALLAVPSWTLLVILLAIGSLVTGLLSLRPRTSSPVWLLDDKERVTWDGFAPRTGLVIALVAAAGVAGAVAVLAIEESGTRGAGLFYPLVGASLVTGICGGLAAAAVSPRICGAAALPAAIASCGLSLVLSVVASTALHLPFGFRQLGSAALSGITASALASIFCVPLAVRAITLIGRTRQ